MYGRSFEMDDAVLDPDYVIPIGKAKVERTGMKRFNFRKLLNIETNFQMALQDFIKTNNISIRKEVYSTLV